MDEAQRPVEGRDGSVVAYRERLVPPPLWWALSLALAASLGVAYGHFLGATAGWVTTLVAEAVFASVLWVQAAPLIRVDELVFRAGRARLPLEYVGEVRVLDAVATKSLRGPQADANVHLCLRPSVADRSVAVIVTDAEDPHPYWLVSSKHPERLAAALTSARDSRATMGR